MRGRRCWVRGPRDSGGLGRRILESEIVGCIALKIGRSLSIRAEFHRTNVATKGKSQNVGVIGEEKK